MKARPVHYGPAGWGPACRRADDLIASDPLKSDDWGVVTCTGCLARRPTCAGPRPCRAEFSVTDPEWCANGPWTAVCSRERGHGGPHVDEAAEWTWIGCGATRVTRAADISGGGRPRLAVCWLEPGHAGPHRGAAAGQTWKEGES